MSSYARLIEFVERLEYDKDEVPFMYQYNKNDEDYYGKFDFAYDDFKIEIHCYVIPSKPEQNGVISVKLLSYDNNRNLILAGVSDSHTVFSKAFHEKVTSWACDSIGFDEPLEDSDWFAQKLKL